MTNFKLVFILLFFVLSTCIMGCRTVAPVQGAVWEMPTKPVVHPVEFVKNDNGLYMDKTSSINLVKNIEGMNAYTEQLEALIKTLKKYYGAK